MVSLKISVKLVVFSIINGSLSVYSDSGILPSVTVGGGVSLDEIALKIARTLDISTHGSYLEQLYTFSNKKIGDGGIEVVYFLLLHDLFVPKNLAKDFFLINKIGDTQDRHIIDYATQRLRWKVEYTNIVYSLLPEEFTLGELQKTYEAILGKKLDKRNFRKKILSLEILRSTRKKKTGVKARPARMYEFSRRTPVMIKVFS